MALNFPNSPTDGQVYSDTPSGNRWVWDSANTVWKATSTFTQTITIASSAPASPATGQLWWNQDFGRLLVYYNDGTSSQWVDASPSDYTSGLAYNTANAAYNLANTHLANTSATFNGNLTLVGNTLPSVDNNYNLGSSSQRWANIYTGDAHFSNEGSEGNVVDGTTGNWTLQEGENNIYMINNKTKKTYKIMLEEV